tara:strand:- start:8812 stop:9153 length:342 start_codon:yes stop_codon:yes gene_type:complete
MAVAISSHQRDGVLCTLTVTADANGDVTTGNTVVGQIVQMSINRTGSQTSTITLTDTSNSMEIFAKSSAAATDLAPDDINAGGGGYCRGPLKVTISSIASADSQTFVIYYIRM